ncbi:HAD family hydrolase [Vibrio mediterranei]|uniref:HAD-IIB family hydrolase n=1 Tax=Vibrio mediterranei TaxID=689 RepID=UPI001EFE3066|nr:HAD-IIB family hydrolase [Vibrio mediterranei]MCG9626219.1 HAD family hydrolase [Vibrio mediterranei]
MIKMLVCDFDGTISGGPTDELTEFTSYVEAQTGMQFVVATGRTFHSINDGLAQHTLPRPHTIVSDVGTQIHHKRTLTPDNDWHTKMDCLWDEGRVSAALHDCGFLGKQTPEHQGSYKLTYEGRLDSKQLQYLQALFRENELYVDLTYSHDWFLDITPKGINKATAIHHLMNKHKLCPSEVVVAGDSGNDTTMLTIAGINAILVANHYQEVAHLSSLSHVYTAKNTHALGVLEGLIHWQNNR